MNNSNNSSTGGVSFCGFVFLIFLTLKLAEVGVVATWSWWWVTAPLWIPFSIVIGITLIAGVILGLYSLIRFIKTVRMCRAIKEDSNE